MDIVWNVVRYFVLVFILYGYLRTLCRHMRTEFTFAVLFSAIGSVMFLAGILNMLREAALLISAGGLVLALRSMLKKESPRPLLTPGTVFYIALCTFMVYVLHGATFGWYDDFSHWATVVKVLLETDRFPSFQDPLIAFQSYPPGMAAFIYFFCKVTGQRAEWLQMYFQSIFTAGMAVSLFAFAKGILANLCAAAGSLMLLCGLLIASALGVDTPLTMTAVAAAAIFFSLFRADPARKNYPQLLPLTVFLIAIKNSGAIFVIMVLCLLIFFGRLYRAPRQLALQAGVPFAVLFLWQKHVYLVFAGGMTTKHSMSLENLSSIFRGKTPADIRLISQVYLRTVLSPQNHVLYLAAAFAALVLAQRFVLQKDPLTLRIMAASGAFYLLYMLGMWGMYIFSMPMGEAESLAAFDRYHNTVLIFVCGSFLIALLPCLHLQPGRPVPALVLAAVSLLALQCCLRPYYRYYTRNFSMTLCYARAPLQAAIEDAGIPQGHSCLVITRDDPGYYIYYMTRYILYSPDCATKPFSGIDDICTVWHSYDYILLYDVAPEDRAKIAEFLGTTSSVLTPADLP